MNKNLPEYWDSVWRREISLEEDVYGIVREERSARWPRIEREVTDAFGSFQDLRVIEIGAGRGSISALMAKNGALVTILDYSEASLVWSREFFLRQGLRAEFVQEDALRIPAYMRGKYDIAMSFGLAEHFNGEERKRILGSHFELLREGGLIFISVPNKFNPPYRLYKWAAELVGSWPVEEYPFSRKEIRALLKQLKIEDYHFLGDSIYESLRWLYFLTYKINPIVIYRRNRVLKDHTMSQS